MHGGRSLGVREEEAKEEGDPSVVASEGSTGGGVAVELVSKGDKASEEESDRGGAKEGNMCGVVTSTKGAGIVMCIPEEGGEGGSAIRQG